MTTNPPLDAAIAWLSAHGWTVDAAEAQTLLESIQLVNQSDGYPWPLPTWTQTQGDPALNDKDALDYLASTVLGDRDSSAGYVWDAAALTVLRTGRAITEYAGD